MRGRTARVAVALAFTALVVSTSGCLTIVTGALTVAASAPRASSGMTIFVVAQPGFLDRAQGDRAEYAIYYGDEAVYPAGGRGASFAVEELTGSIFVPYSHFVVGNGPYDVVVRYDGEEYRARVDVHKWANYVFLHPFDQGTNIKVQAALGSATGGRPEDRVLAKGDLIVDIHYRGLDGTEDRVIGSARAETRNDAISTTINVPRSKLDAGPGYYSFEPVFHNDEAKNNLQVRADPTMANRHPPWNWIYITR